MMLKPYAALLILVSVITFFLYAVDKKRAVKGEWRISEKVLLGFSLFLGGVGGYLGMHLFRHKTSKVKFHLVNLFGIVWQIGLLIYLLVA